MLWSLLSRCVLPKLVPADAVAREVELARRAAKRSKSGVGLSGKLLSLASDASSAPNRLLAWVAAVCAIRGLRVHDLGVGLRDGLALCLLVRHYLPDVLPDAANALIDASALPNPNNAADRAVAGGLAPPSAISDPHSALSAAAAKAAEARAAAFATALTSVGCVPPLISAADAHGCGPDSHVASLLLGCLFSRLTEVGKQQSAAQQLQLAWINRTHRTDSRANLRRALKAYAVQRRWRSAVAIRRAKAALKAKLAIRAALRARMLRVRLSRLVAFVARAKARRANEAATLIQEAGLTMVLARRCGESTIVVQKYARRPAAAGLPHRAHHHHRRAGDYRRIVAQPRARDAPRGTTPPRRASRRPAAPSPLSAFATAGRGDDAAGGGTRPAASRLAATMRVARDAAAATTLQSALGVYAQRRLRLARVPALRLQSAARSLAARRFVGHVRECLANRRRVQLEFRRKIDAMHTIQSRLRTALAMNRLRRAVVAATLIGSAYRSLTCRRRFSQNVSQATVLQSAARGRIERRKLGELRRAALTLQAAARAVASGRDARLQLHGKGGRHLHRGRCEGEDGERQVRRRTGRRDSARGRVAPAHLQAPPRRLARRRGGAAVARAHEHRPEDARAPLVGSAAAVVGAWTAGPAPAASRHARRDGALRHVASGGRRSEARRRQVVGSAAAERRAPNARFARPAQPPARGGRTWRAHAELAARRADTSARRATRERRRRCRRPRAGAPRRPPSRAGWRRSPCKRRPPPHPRPARRSSGTRARCGCGMRPR